MQLPTLSVVVITYQREQVLCDTIARLLSLDYPRWELLVVDQTRAHEPSTQSFLQQVSPKIRYLRIQKVGICHARNVGIEAARGELMLFCDDDIIPDPSLLTMHARHYRDSSVGGVTGATHIQRRDNARKVRASHDAQRLLTRPCRAQNLRRAQPSMGGGAVELQPLAADGPVFLLRGGEARRGPPPATVVEADSATGCNMSFRKQLLARIGGFDEGFIHRAHREETDVSLRVRALGYRLLFDPEARVEHLVFPAGGSRSHANQDRQYTYGWFHNNAYFFGKHMPLKHLPYFLRYHLGHLLYRQVWQRRRVMALYPALAGMADGLGRGRKARRQNPSKVACASARKRRDRDRPA